MDPSLNVFFSTVRDLYVGNNMHIYFAMKDPSTSPHLLPGEESEPIPFSSSQLQSSIPSFTSPWNLCSINSTQNVLGLETKVLATITHSLENTTLLQDYTILEAPKRLKLLEW